MSQFDFIQVYADRLLDDNGFADLDETTRSQYAPQLISEIERRVGLKLMPVLSVEADAQLNEMIANPKTTPEDLKKFWFDNVPDFETKVRQILGDFAEEFKGIMEKIRTKSN